MEYSIWEPKCLSVCLSFLSCVTSISSTPVSLSHEYVVVVVVHLCCCCMLLFPGSLVVYSLECSLFLLLFFLFLLLLFVVLTCVVFVVDLQLLFFTLLSWACYLLCFLHLVVVHVPTLLPRVALLCCCSLWLCCCSCLCVCCYHVVCCCCCCSLGVL